MYQLFIYLLYCRLILKVLVFISWRIVCYLRQLSQVGYEKEKEKEPTKKTPNFVMNRLQTNVELQDKTSLLIHQLVLIC